MDEKLKKESQDTYPGWLLATVDLLEQRTVGVNYTLYLLGFGGLAIVARRVRPFKKFVQPNSIPKHFFDKKYKLKGKIIGMDFIPQPVLLVDHEPLLLNSLRRKGPGLPVSFESINLSSNAVSWLQSLCIGKRVTFVVMEPHTNCVSSIVKDGNFKNDLATELVSVGFASVGSINPRLSGDKLYSIYYNKLLKSQKLAKINGNGIWMNDSKRKTISQSIVSLGASVYNYVLPIVMKGTLASFKLLRQAIPPSTVTVAK